MGGVLPMGVRPLGVSYRRVGVGQLWGGE